MKAVPRTKSIFLLPVSFMLADVDTKLAYMGMAAVGSRTKAGTSNERSSPFPYVYVGVLHQAFVLPSELQLSWPPTLHPFCLSTNVSLYC